MIYIEAAEIKKLTFLTGDFFGISDTDFDVITTEALLKYLSDDVCNIFTYLYAT